VWLPPGWGLSRVYRFLNLSRIVLRPLNLLFSKQQRRLSFKTPFSSSRECACAVQDDCCRDNGGVNNVRDMITASIFVMSSHYLLQSVSPSSHHPAATTAYAIRWQGTVVSGRRHRYPLFRFLFVSPIREPPLNRCEGYVDKMPASLRRDE